MILKWPTVIEADCSTVDAEMIWTFNYQQDYSWPLKVTAVIMVSDVLGR